MLGLLAPGSSTPQQTLLDPDLSINIFQLYNEEFKDGAQVSIIETSSPTEDTTYTCKVSYGQESFTSSDSLLVFGKYNL